MSGKTSLMQKRSRCWVFTVWNPTEADTDSLRASTKPKSGVVGMESPNAEDDRFHLQGYARFENPLTGSAVKKWLGRNDAHLELPISSDYHNHRYCTKEGSVVVMWGEEPKEPKATSTHSDWDFVHDQVKHGKDILTILDEKPHMTRYISSMRQLITESEVKQQAAWRDVKTTYMTGSAGIGKSRAIMEKYGHENVYRITDKKNPWDGYRGEPVVVFEEYRSNFGVENMLNWLDGYPIMLPCRYANRPAQFERVFLITNIGLEDQFTGTQDSFPETWGAFLRRIDDIVVGCAKSEQWARWSSVTEYADCNGYPEWISLLKGTAVTMKNSPLDWL